MSDLKPSEKTETPAEETRQCFPVQLTPMRIDSIVENGRIYASWEPKTTADRMAMYRILRGEVLEPERMINVEFAPKEMSLHPVEWTKENGEVVQAVACTFVCHDGKTFQIRSAGIWSSVRDLIRLRLCPPWCRDIVLKLTRRPCKTKPDQSYYAFEMVGEYKPDKKPGK